MDLLLRSDEGSNLQISSHVIMTEDPTCFIEDYGAGWVLYRSIDNTRWIIQGLCNQCGMCEQDDAPYLIWYKRKGLPGACIDTRWGSRRDVPVRPEIGQMPECTLSGKYLDGN
jgi:hypothetical protein